MFPRYLVSAEPNEKVLRAVLTGISGVESKGLAVSYSVAISSRQMRYGEIRLSNLANGRPIV